MHLVGFVLSIYRDARSRERHRSPFIPSGCGNIDRSFIVTSKHDYLMF